MGGGVCAGGECDIRCFLFIYFMFYYKGEYLYFLYFSKNFCICFGVCVHSFITVLFFKLFLLCNFLVMLVSLQLFWFLSEQVPRSYVILKRFEWHLEVWSFDDRMYKQVGAVVGRYSALPPVCRWPAIAFYFVHNWRVSCSHWHSLINFYIFSVAYWLYFAYIFDSFLTTVWLNFVKKIIKIYCYGISNVQ